MARLGPPLATPQNPRDKVSLWVLFLSSFPGSEAHNFFYWPQMGILGGKFRFTKCMCFFYPFRILGQLGGRLLNADRHKMLCLELDAMGPVQVN